jgi:hypothetical protein
MDCLILCLGQVGRIPSMHMCHVLPAGAETFGLEAMSDPIL